MKKFSKLLIVICLLFASVVYADEYGVKDRNELDNYGVTKKEIKITDKNKSNVLRTPYVDASIKVYDFVDVLTDEEEEKLRDEIKEFSKITNMDLVVLLVDLSKYYSDSYVEDYAADFYDYNDFGIDYDNYSGVIMIRDTVGRRDDIVLTGNAQLYYDSSRLNDINDYINDAIVYDQYYNTFHQLIERCTMWYKSGMPSSMKYAYLDETGFIRYRFKPPYLIATLISAIVTAITISIYVSKNKMVKKATDANDYLNKESVVYSVKENNLVHTHTTSYRIDSSSGGGGGGGFHGSSGIGHSSGGVHHR